jgi:hypothetical protein
MIFMTNKQTQRDGGGRYREGRHNYLFLPLVFFQGLATFAFLVAEQAERAGVRRKREI